MKKLVEKCVDGAKILDLCIEGDQLIEEGTGSVYNKAVKGVKVTKGEFCLFVPGYMLTSMSHPGPSARSLMGRYRVSDVYICEQLCFAFLSTCVRLVEYS